MKMKPILFSGPMVQAILEGRKTQTRRIVKPQPEPPRCIYDESNAIPILKPNGDDLLLRWNWKREMYDGKILQDAESFSNKCPYGRPDDKDWQSGLPTEPGMYIVEGFEKPIYLTPVPAGTYPDIDYPFITWGWSESDDTEDISQDGGPTVDTIKWKRHGDVLYVRETWQHIPGSDGGYVYKASENGRDWEENDEGWKWKPSLFMPKKAARIFLRITDIRVERLQDITEEDAISEGVEYIVSDMLRGYTDYSTPKGVTGVVDSPIQSFRTLWESINGPESWQANPFCWVLSFEKIEKPES